MIELLSVSKGFGPVVALRDLDLKVEDGEIFGLLGPNGAGKTTAIRVMAGLLRPSAGTVLIDGFDVWKEPLKAKALIGLVPDRPYLYGKLTAEEFLHFAAQIRSIDGAQASSRISRLLGVFGLDRWKDDLIEHFSHGMRQRLVFAASLLHEPRALIVDEPMVGLDPRGGRLVKEIFQEEASKRGTSIVVSTHQIEVAQQVCHRIAILDRGEIVEMGSPDELLSKTGRPDLESVFLQLTGPTRPP